jgi:hypothetical protein
MTKLQDPLTPKAAAEKKQKLTADISAQDISALPMSAFTAIAPSVAKKPDPFDGYPLGPDVRLGETVVSSTFVIALNPTIFVAQDPSGIGVSQVDRAGNEKLVNIKTYHNRIITDYSRGSGTNSCDVVFDREVTLDGGQKVSCAIVPVHSIRAQIMFALDRKKQGIQVDKRYMYLDPRQGNRLRSLFLQLVNPLIKKEREAEDITAAFEASQATA